jgi:hypothetical protein
MAHSHYVMDLYFRQEGAKPDAMHREVMRIVAADDAEAVEEATRISGWREPTRYDVRAITNSVRSGDRLVHASVAEPIVDDDLPHDVG